MRKREGFINAMIDQNHIIFENNEFKLKLNPNAPKYMYGVCSLPQTTNKKVAAFNGAINEYKATLEQHLKNNLNKLPKNLLSLWTNPQSK